MENPPLLTTNHAFYQNPLPLAHVKVICCFCLSSSITYSVKFSGSHFENLFKSFLAIEYGKSDINPRLQRKPQNLSKTAYSHFHCDWFRDRYMTSWANENSSLGFFWNYWAGIGGCNLSLLILRRSSSGSHYVDKSCIWGQ
jgi:hypothetical protein